MRQATSIDDLREMARRRVPRAFFDYVDGGSYSEATLKANRADLQALKFRQRVMVDVSARSTACSILGRAATMPVVLAPTGLTGLVHADGEILAARAAAQVGVPFCLSTMSICSLEQVRAATDTPFWFQLYVMRDRGFVASLLERARQADCPVLVLTADLQVQGQRHRDIRNGLSVPPRLTFRSLLDFACRPRWAMGMLGTANRSFGNLAAYLQSQDLATLSQWIAQQFDPSLSWRDLEWIRSLWPGKLVVKGILDPDDARTAVACGADAVVVSNHGGRQLDHAPSSVSVLAAIAEAVRGKAEVFMDGGVRSGQDVAKALACGADAAMIGRAFLYGLGAGGEDGVRTALEIIRRELDVTLALAGCCSPAELTPRHLHG
ncbi:alpha-hydroxy acid oxidase [Xanthobacter sp. KR7-225]|uniref:alpha-hydroxy acid oxidase n=1 Tax=Xanthobacter sp. KR7-225 TaxID=3156613 RepID=UPI0032B5AE42